MNDSRRQALFLPIEPYELKDGYYRFGTRVRSRWILWARHLGDDIVAKPGTSVRSIGQGKVVWSGMRLGNVKKRNWGGLVIIEHTKSPRKVRNEPRGKQISTQDTFYSVYGHLSNLRFQAGDHIRAGDVVGEIAEGLTPENGWWQIPHLHFAIYTGPWTGEILPGYKRFFDGRTKFAWWRDPASFIEDYNRSR